MAAKMAAGNLKQKCEPCQLNKLSPHIVVQGTSTLPLPLPPFGSRAFAISGPQLWNSLPLDVKLGTHWGLVTQYTYCNTKQVLCFKYCHNMCIVIHVIVS